MTTPPEGRLAPQPLHDPPLLRAHVRWILLVTAVAVVSACVLPLLLQGMRYRSEAEVLVGAVTAAALPPTMETEVQVVGSAAVLTEVVEETGTSLRRLQRNLSVTVPPESTVLLIRYWDDDPAGAQDHAQAIADAYVGFRTGASTVLSPATRPTSPSSPDFLLNSSAGLVLGLLLGVGSALVRDRLDDRVRGPRDVEQRTGVPVLATVRAPDAGGPGAAEAYRILRTKVERVAGAGEGLVIAVAGTRSDDGARRTAEGLAAALARTGARVVLVDADLRAAAATAGAGDVEPGLADVLRQHTALADVLRNGAVAGLRLLGPGRSSEGVEDLLAGPSVVELLQRLRAGADHVVVHVAPVEGAAETLVIVAKADLVILSAVIGGTTRAQLTTAVSEVRSAHAPSVGCVVHDTARPEDETVAARPPAEPRTAPGEGPGVVRMERPQPGPQRADSREHPLSEGGSPAASVVDRR